MYATAASTITRGVLAARRRLADTVRDERGDVPGWVLITLMTAGLPVMSIMGVMTTQTAADASATMTVRFIDAEDGRTLGASEIDIAMTTAQIGETDPVLLLELEGEQREIVLEAVRIAYARYPEGPWFDRVRDAISGWTDAEVSERLGCALSMVPWMRVTGRAWYIAEYVRLCDFVGVEPSSLLRRDDLDG